jgi:hypothetical protein
VDGLKEYHMEACTDAHMDGYAPVRPGLFNSPPLPVYPRGQAFNGELRPAPRTEYSGGGGTVEPCPSPLETHRHRSPMACVLGESQVPPPRTLRAQESSVTPLHSRLGWPCSLWAVLLCPCIWLVHTQGIWTAGDTDCSQCQGRLGSPALGLFRALRK